MEKQLLLADQSTKIYKLYRQMHSIEGVSLSEARGVPDIRWVLKDASFLVGQGLKENL